MNRNVLRMARRALGKPPSYLARRAMQELRAEAERFFGPRRARAFGLRQLLALTGATSLDELWQRLASRPFVSKVESLSLDQYDELCPTDASRIFRAAEYALTHQVDLLGSGTVRLGPRIDWHRDYKSGFRWEPQYFRDIDIMNPGRPSDVKFPWELSRMQWVIPCGQAWKLTGEERWAAGARELLEDWIASNPYGESVNWTCTMEAALRILTWTWLFHACGKSQAWADDTFRARFLTCLYLHGDFTDRHIEYADVNGNHCDADAAGLVFAGLFFGAMGQPRAWLDRGWNILCDELPRQVSEDGVDFEGSVPYHRLVTELFFLPALYRQRCGLEVPQWYRERVRKMGWFTETYTRPDGTAPVWGDADDARALPFGGQNINDHRYLLGWIGESFSDPALAARMRGDIAECVWLLGPTPSTNMASHAHDAKPPKSVLFPNGGYAVLRNAQDHVFVDCGPVGLANRGGHGHNDILSFEAVLDGHQLVSDCGAYVYTADYVARNAFRSTSFHNTPMIDGQELNRFLSPEDLWWLRAEAFPEDVRLEVSTASATLTAAHAAYRRLQNPITVRRTLRLDLTTSSLTIRDDFIGAGHHLFEVPLHLPANVTIESSDNPIIIRSRQQRFMLLATSAAEWVVSIARSKISPSYGRLTDGTRVLWHRTGVPVALELRIARA